MPFVKTRVALRRRVGVRVYMPLPLPLQSVA